MKSTFVSASDSECSPRDSVAHSVSEANRDSNGKVLLAADDVDEVDEAQDAVCQTILEMEMVTETIPTDEEPEPGVFDWAQELAVLLLCIACRRF